ncbi:MAG: hypothetical protein ACRD1Z_07940 [Vicinamibacteria bacterium]
MGLRPSAQEGALRRLAILLSATWSLSCRSPEHELIDRFLEASSRQDNQSVALLSMVAFPGEVVDFRVLTLGEERRGPYRVSSMRERVDEAENRRVEQFKLFGDFRQANYDELLKLQRLVRDEPGRKLDGRLGELQRQWDAFREERDVVVSSLHEAEQELEGEIRRVHKSLQREAAPEFLTGETLTKEASVRVTTKDDGEGVYVVTLTRYDVKNSFGAVVPTRWMVTAVAPEAE